MASSSPAGSNSPQIDSTSSAGDSYNTINAPPPSPKMVAPPPPPSFPNLSPSPLSLPFSRSSTLEGSEGDKEEDSKELRLKVEVDVEDEHITPS